MKINTPSAGDTRLKGGRMPTRTFLLLSALLIAVTLLAGGAALAQENADAACPALVQRALDDLGDNCSVLDRNSACYGFNRVDATFTEVMTASFFSKPADRAGLEAFQRITTAPLDTARDYWGIALMNVQANVPGSLPGQAVVFLLMGDTEVENAVDPAEMYTPAEPLAIETVADASLHSGPTDAANLVATAAAGETLLVDALSADETWLRALTDFGPAWVSRAALDPQPDLSGLPRITENSRTPMQSFQLRTAFTDLECAQAPSLLALQSPRGIKVDLTANGADIRMGSRAILRMLPPGNIMEIITVEGLVTLEPGTPNERVIPAGMRVRAQLDENGLIILTSFSDPEPIDPADFEFIETVNAAYARLGLQEGDSVQQVQQQAGPVSVIDANACTAGEQISYTVVSGDTLFGLALTYSTSVDAIIQANGLRGTLITPGQQLAITCGATVPRTLPSLGAPPANGGSAAAVDCRPFRATSPLDGLPYGSGTFYWDAAPGADGYRVVVTGESGATIFNADGVQTSLSADLSINSIGYGFNFSWYVEALSGGAVACGTPPVGMFREAPIPDAPPSTGGPSDDRPGIRPLSLTPLCSFDPFETRSWLVTNPNPFAVPVRWVGQGEQFGSFSALPGLNFFLTDAIIEGSNAVTLFWTDASGAEQQVTSEGSDEPCLAQESGG